MEEELYIEHFGPIDQAEISIRKVTVLIGPQGSGKSTIAKLYSLFTWLEKSLMRHSLRPKDVETGFKKKYCAYNGIDDYFTEQTKLEFIGYHYSFKYSEERLTIEENVIGDDSFNVSKVMYIPAERSILGSVDHPSSMLKGLSKPMVTFSEEYAVAKNNTKGGYEFPFGDVGFEYDALNDMPNLRLIGGKRIRLSSGSSGFQSSLPLLLVSRNLTEMVRNSTKNSELGEKEKKALLKEVEAVLSAKELSEDVKKAYLQTISSRFRYSRLVNIVEEMELNLFPDSQKGVLYELMANTISLASNRLMLTTHSPYVVNYLTLAIKAKSIMDSVEDSQSDVAQRLDKIVPIKSQISASDVVIYELSDSKINRLSDYYGIPSDANFLNDKLNESNLMFDELLEIEDELKK